MPGFDSHHTQNQGGPRSHISPCLSCWAREAFWQGECRSPRASGSPQQQHKDVLLPASSIAVTVQESKAGLGLGCTELGHGSVTAAIKEYSGGKLFTLIVWLVSSPQLARRSSQYSKGLLESQGIADSGVLILIMLKARQENPKL